MIHLVWLAVLAPVVGAVLNGVLAFARPRARTAVSVIGVGVVAVAFAVAVAIFVAMLHDPRPAVQVVLWHWMPVTPASRSTSRCRWTT